MDIGLQVIVYQQFYRIQILYKKISKNKWKQNKYDINLNNKTLVNWNSTTDGIMLMIFKSGTSGTSRCN